MGVNQRAQVAMTEPEIATFLQQQRTATFATVSPSGTPHLVAMWFAVLDGVLWFETKRKAQKTVNLLRDPRLTVLVEDGHTYDTLRGVSLEGRGVVVDDADALWEVCVSVWERYTGPYTEDMRPFVETMLRNRVAVRLDVERVRSWDHRKLGMPAVPLGGSTAQYL
jgi:PPOX class probable F420-dependent enzyme